MDKKDRSIKISIVLSIALSITFILCILYFTIDEKTIEQLESAKIRYEFFSLAILLNVIYWILWGARIKVLANAVDSNVKITIWKGTEIAIANLFLACITPSMAGGEPVRIYLLKKEGMNIGSSTGVVLGERLIDAIFVLSMVPFGLFIYKDRIDIAYLSTGLWIGIIVFIIAIILFIYGILHPDKIKSILIYLNKKFRKFLKRRGNESRIIKKISKDVDNFHDSVICFSKNKKALILATFLTILFWSTGFMIPSMILLGLGLDPFFIESYAAQILLLVIVMMPTTPGSSGVAEVSIAGLYSLLVGKSLIGVFTILYRFISYYMNFIAGAVFQYKIFKSITSFSINLLRKS